MLDTSLSSERLVYRLFHERGVRVFKSVPIAAQCSCSRDGVEAMLRNFSQDDRDHMVEDGKISVTCEFCSANYQFAPDDVRPDAGARNRTARQSPKKKPKIPRNSKHDRARTLDGRGGCRGDRGARVFDDIGPRAKLPGPLADARRLVLVTAETMNDTAASMRLYERTSTAASWRALGAAEPALIGRGGMGWSPFFPSARASRRADQGRGR